MTPSQSSFVLELQATPEEVMRGVGRLRQLGQDCGLAEPVLYALALSLEEAASNVVKHAYGYDAAQSFSVAARCADGCVQVELRDHGPAFDPTQAPAPDPAEMEDRPEGGWGIPLVRHYMDELRYRREGNENVLQMIKRGPLA